MRELSPSYDLIKSPSVIHNLLNVTANTNGKELIKIPLNGMINQSGQETAQKKPLQSNLIGEMIAKLERQVRQKRRQHFPSTLSAQELQKSHITAMHKIPLCIHLVKVISK